jgi:Uma2 family endonuclease
MALPAHKLLSYRDYLDLEASTGVRHEYLNGVAVAMSGGSLRHSRLKTEFAYRVRASLPDNGPCRPYDSDGKVRAVELDYATYPDLSIVCGPVIPHPDDRHALTNPSLLAEVLSPSTEGYDRGDKFAYFRSISTLDHYVLVSTSVVRIDHFSRQADGSWTLRAFGPGETLVIEDLGVRVALDDIYRDLPEDDQVTRLPASETEVENS